MKVRIIAAGKVRTSPEGQLAREYIDRFDRAGREIGLGPVSVVEYGAGPEAGLPKSQIDRAISDPGSVLCTLDGSGSRLTSPEFSRLLAQWRDRGLKEAVFLIGGAGGIGKSVLERADTSVSFGAMVFPHLLARVMLAEQLYRAVSILRGTPYHRE